MSRVSSLTRVRGRVRLAALGAAALLLVGSTSIIAAAVATSNGPFNACLGAKTAPGQVYGVTADGSVPTCKPGDLPITFSNAQGPAGVTGPQGPAGATGAQGPAGAKGATGDPGPAGASGPAGSPGAAGATGPAGAPGPSGAPGSSGAPGPSGAAGATGPAGNSVTVTDVVPCTNGAPCPAQGCESKTGCATPHCVSIQVVDPNGAPVGDPAIVCDGAAGSPGPSGEPGATGAPGPTGEPGPSGAPGAPGAAGTGGTGGTGSGCPTGNVALAGGTNGTLIYEYQAPVWYSSLIGQVAATSSASTGVKTVNCAGTLKGFSVTGSGDPEIASAYYVPVNGIQRYAIAVVVNGSASALACTITQGSTGCSSAASIPVSPGDEVNVSVTPTCEYDGGPCYFPTPLSFTWTATFSNPATEPIGP